VQWCPTNDMIADYMTKPLQGKLFRGFRDLIMGLGSPSDRIVAKDEKTCLALVPVCMFAHISCSRVFWRLNGNPAYERAAVRLEGSEINSVTVSISNLEENREKSKNKNGEMMLTLMRH
jgi:hypothetical protein